MTTTPAPDALPEPVALFDPMFYDFVHPGSLEVMREELRPSYSVKLFTEDQLRAALASQAEKHAAELAKLRQGEPVAGWRLLKDTTYAERSWPEDASHENGCYSNTCCHCGRAFTGHKRRPSCKACSAASTPPAQPPREALQPLSDERIADLWSPHPGGYVRRPILGWGKVCDFARAVIAEFCKINGITERMSAAKETGS